MLNKQSPRTIVPIDFSKGIRSDIITQNFNVVEDMLKRERLSVAGHGVSSGLSINIKGFTLEITEGALVAFDGKEIFFEDTVFNVPLPRLTHATDEVYTVGEDGIIVLPHTPYHINRKHVANGRDNTSGLIIAEYNNSMNTYLVEATDGNTIMVNPSLKGKLVKVSYYYTEKRYDTVYIDTDNKIKLIEGTTSSSPSVLLPEESAYILSFIEIDPYSPDSEVRYKAALKIKEDLRGRRNLYTDENNRLYICGTPFDDLQIIHMAMPLNPFENQLWYDIEHNKLKVWKTVDEIASWVNVNDTSIIPVLEQKLWTPETNPGDRQRFIFDNIKDHAMKFIPKRNELALYVDQGVIHSDQFFELTLEDARSNPDLKDLLINTYHYSEDEIMNIDGLHENYGIGFEFYFPLENPSYVEARTTHRVTENPLANRFQRTATFISEGMTTVRSTQTEFETSEPYRCGENQLEVFMDGKKLIKGVQFKEGADIKTESGEYVASIPKGTISHRYRILIDIPSNTFIHYRITSNIYSYDHVEGMVGGLGDRVVEIEDKTTNALTTINNTKLEVDRTLQEVKKDIQDLKDNNNEDSFYKKGESIAIDDLPDELMNDVLEGAFYKTFDKVGAYVTLGAYAKASTIHLNCFLLTETERRILIQGKDASDARADFYLDVSDEKNANIVFINNELPDEKNLYVTGMVFGARMNQEKKED